LNEDLLGNPIALLLAAAGTAAVVVGQSEPTNPPAFEVSSVRQNTSQNVRRTDIEFLPGGRFTASNVPLFLLVRVAYDLPARSNRLTGGADWVRSERYDIEAKAEKDSIPPGL